EEVVGIDRPAVAPQALLRRCDQTFGQVSPDCVRHSCEAGILKFLLILSACLNPHHRVADSAEVSRWDLGDRLQVVVEPADGGGVLRAVADDPRPAGRSARRRPGCGVAYGPSAAVLPAGFLTDLLSKPVLVGNVPSGLPPTAFSTPSHRSR